MEDRIDQLLSWCSEIDFGPINLSEREYEFYRRLNNEIVLLCKSLPESAQTDAILFFMRYSGVSLGQNLNFFGNYYTPSWSIIFWLIENGPNKRGLTERDIKNAITAHSMAMFLHSLDDHLSDAELPVTHLALLLRSQSWMIMNNAFSSLVEGVDKGEKIVRSFIDDYYSAIGSSHKIESFDGYCELFRKQMATGFIAPLLMSRKIAFHEDFAGAIQDAYGSFGIAWRLLDDIKDIETDMKKGTHSAIYKCLPERIRKFWVNHAEAGPNLKKDYADGIFNYIMENSVMHRIKERICRELESAAFIADYHKISGLADEFRGLLKPLQNGQTGL